jgi:hypothetical protein
MDENQPPFDILRRLEAGFVVQMVDKPETTWSYPQAYHRQVGLQVQLAHYR